jgi:hypothetical protein
VFVSKAAPESRIACGVFVLVALVACAEAPTPATRLVPVTETDAPVRWIGPVDVPLLQEPEETARGFAALDAVLSFWGRPGDRRGAGAPREHEAVLAGVLERSVRAAGLSAVSFHGTLEDLLFELRSGRPVIVGMAEDGGTSPVAHYEVVVGWDPAGRRLRSLDPVRGFVERPAARFLDEWESARQFTLVVFDPEATTMGTPSSNE